MTSVIPPPGQERLAKRDFIILPLLCLVTVSVMLIAAELVARVVFIEGGREACAEPDALHRYHFESNCVSHQKMPEAPNVEYAFNDCGYRTKESCRRRPAYSLRVALLGSSTAEGLAVPYDQIFAARVSKRLSAACGRSVEFQNMGAPGYSLLDSYLKTDEALALRPDLVMLVIIPFDIEADVEPPQLANRFNREMLARMGSSVQAEPRSVVASMNRFVRAAASDSRAVLAAQYLLFQNPVTYVDLYLRLGDKSDFLRSQLTPSWKKHLADLELLLGEMAQKIHAAGIPFVLVLGPVRAQAVLLEAANRPSGIDPYALVRRVAAIAARHRVIFVDVLDEFSSDPHPEESFYTVDGHPNGRGHAMFAKAIERRLTDGDLPAFADCGKLSQVAR
jgi:hypothetical protein